MPDFAAIALLACAVGDSLPAHVRPLLDADSDRVAYTVAQYMDSTVTRWRYAGEVEAVVEDPAAGQVLVLIVPLAGEGQSAGVEAIEPAPPMPERHDGRCGRIFSWR